MLRLLKGAVISGPDLGASSPAAKGKASPALAGASLSSLGVYLCLEFHLVHRTGIVLDPCWDGSLQPPSS